MIGNSCLIAQLSGIDWKSEKLQKYVSDNDSSRFCRSSGTSFMSFTSFCSLTQIAQ